MFGGIELDLSDVTAMDEKVTRAKDAIAGTAEIIDNKLTWR